MPRHADGNFKSSYWPASHIKESQKSSTNLDYNLNTSNEKKPEPQTLFLQTNDASQPSMFQTALLVALPAQGDLILQRQNIGAVFNFTPM